VTRAAAVVVVQAMLISQQLSATFPNSIWPSGQTPCAWPGSPAPRLSYQQWKTFNIMPGMDWALFFDEWLYIYLYIYKYSSSNAAELSGQLDEAGLVWFGWWRTEKLSSDDFISLVSLVRFPVSPHA